MKKLIVLLMFGLGTALFYTCKEEKKADPNNSSTNVVPPASDNSAATNPSMADTAYSTNDTLHAKKDTAQKK